jgi:hypothetical protein
MTQKPYTVNNFRTKTPLLIHLNYSILPHKFSINKGTLLYLSSLSPSSLSQLSNYQKLCPSAATMLSTLPPSDPFLDNPFSAFSAGFPPWDFHDLFSDDIKPITPLLITSSSGSDEPNQPHEKRKPDSDRVIDERKRRRMISNRESARRSRMRKQRHVENLRNQLNKCRLENREMKNRLQFILYHLNRIRTENEWLRSERTVLNQKINNYTQILVYQQFQPFSPAWTCNTTTVE